MTSKNDGQNGQSAKTSHLGRVVSGVGGMMRAVAGVPAGVSRDRRGTFLVMVIGTLALLAVIAVAHFAIGQSDRRASGALTRADAKGDIPSQFASYVKQIISDDLFTRRYEDTNALIPNNELAFRARAIRVASDIPMTDWRTTSVSLVTSLGNGYVDNPEYFTPTGRWSDNWLASTEPTWISTFAGAAPAVHPDATRAYRDTKDWAHISNLSPDGRFVNLWNLRNNFDAESGFGQKSAGKYRTSANQFVIEIDQNNNPGRMIQRTDFGASFTATPPTPGMLANRQRGLFMPTDIDFTQLDAQARIGNAQYHPYSFADADGDKFFDSRWIELVDARDVNNPINSLVSDGSKRWFFAARVIDLSGLVNVNTATDSSQAPGVGFPIGISPAEIDLKRLLSMQDVIAATGSAGGGYDKILQPTAAGAGDNYALYDAAMALQVGAKAYDATMRVRVYNEMPPALPQVASWVWPTTWNGATVPAALVGVDRWLGWRSYASSISGASFLQGTGEMLSPWFTITDTAELLSRHGVNDVEVTSRIERAMGGRLSPNLPAMSRYSPLRDNRSEELEANRLNAAGTGASDAAMIAMATDVRRQLTTVSGARPLASAPVDGGSAGVLQGTDLRTNLSDLVRNNTLTSPGNITSLFDKVYASALAPALRIPGVWETSGANYPKLKTLFYGHQGPQLALFASAFMTANLVDALKPVGSEMGKYTVVFDSSTAQDLFLRNQAAGSDLGYLSYVNAQGLPAFPWFRQGLAGRAQLSEFCLDTKNSTQALSRLAVTRTSSSPARTPVADVLTVPPAVNVFGTRAQPFITQVGCYTMYTDAPRPPGDVDTVPVIRGQPPSQGITLNGTIAAANADFVMRVLAFQIHNPFDEPVTLSSQTATSLNQFAPNTDAGYYYVTMQDDPTSAAPATRAVKLVGVTHPAAGEVNLVPITIGAGETIVCYTLSESREDVVARINAVAPGGAGGDAILQGWLDTQLRAGAAGPNKINALYEVPRITPTDHAAYTTTFDELAQGALAGSTPATSVQLWKSERLSKEILDPQNLTLDELLPVTTVGGVAVFPRNLLGDDRMMDRFGLGTVAAPLVLDRRLEGGNNRITGTFAGPQSNGLHTPINSNTGITLTLWATVKRPTDPNSLAGAANIAAAIPLGGIPAYCIEPKSWTTNWNERKTDAIDPSTNLITLDGAKIDLDPVAAAWEFATWQARQVNAAPMSPTMSAAPWAQGNGAGLNIPNNRESRPYIAMRQTMLATATADNGFGNARSFTTILPGQIANDPPAATLRATDMLLPMCVGPWEAPVDRNSAPQTNGMVRWTTLAEAWAIAMGYEDLTLANIPQGAAGSNPLTMYANVAPAAQSRGSQSPRPVTDYGHLVLDDFVPFYDSDSNGRFDPSNVMGGTNHDLRLGLGIPAALTILDSITTSDSTFGGLTRATPGLINLNTATAQALRCVPMLTPPDPAANLLWTPPAGGSLPLKPQVDIAASMLAYRDKVPVDVLPTHGTSVMQPRFMDTDIVDGAVDQVIRPDFVGMQSGRARKNRIDGVREMAGFASPGEAMCVLTRNPTAFGSNVAGRDDVTNIDHLAFNTKNDSQAGIASLFRKDAAGALVPDAVSDKYEEKLMIAAALSNTTSVRSDIFACWFVIRGYGRDDCEGLGSADPMVPSVERRFLMILDRSNITRIGDEPKVLLFQELPM